MRQMANHEMKNLSPVDSGPAIARRKVEFIILASSWREVRQAGMTGLRIRRRAAPGALRTQKTEVKTYC
jgi:hypothetical protein